MPSSAPLYLRTANSTFFLAKARNSFKSLSLIRNSVVGFPARYSWAMLVKPVTFFPSFASAQRNAARFLLPAARSLILASVIWMLSFTIRSATSPLVSIRSIHLLIFQIRKDILNAAIPDVPGVLPDHLPNVPLPQGGRQLGQHPHILGHNGMLQQRHAPPWLASHSLFDMEKQSGDLSARGAATGQRTEIGVAAARIYSGKTKYAAPGSPGQKEKIGVFLPAQLGDTQVQTICRQKAALPGKAQDRAQVCLYQLFHTSSSFVFQLPPLSL